MKILVNEQLSAHRYKTPEGYLICTDAILARTGPQTYRKNEIFADSDDDSEIEVNRTEDEVFAPQTLASFENKPITVEHPDEDVNVHNYKDYAVGFVRDVKRGKTSDGQDVILGNLVITDEQTIEEIENGEHTDLSCGYDCDIEDEAHPCQRNIRGNHVALCEQGRAGIARIVDSALNDSLYALATKTGRYVVEGTHKLSRQGSYGAIPMAFDTNQEAMKYAKAHTFDEPVFVKEITYRQYQNGCIDSINDTDYVIYNRDEEELFRFKTMNEAKKKVKELKEFDRRQKNPFNENYHIEVEDATQDSTFVVGWIDNYDQACYDEIMAKDANEARNLIEKKYKPYKIFEVRQLDSVKDIDFLAVKRKNEATKWLKSRGLYEEFIEKDLYKKYTDYEYAVLKGMKEINDSVKDRTILRLKPEKVQRGDIIDYSGRRLKVLNMSKIIDEDKYHFDTKDLDTAVNFGIDIKKDKEIDIIRDSIQDNKVIKYANNKLGKQFVIEEQDDGTAIVKNSFGQYRAFPSIKKAEETLRSKGFTIFDELDEDLIEDELIQSGSEEAFKKNVATEIKSGKDPKQAVAIAHSVKRANDSYNKFANETDKNFLKEAISEMSRYERNWTFMSAKEKKNIAPNGLKELKENLMFARNRLKELDSKHDSIAKLDKFAKVINIIKSIKK